MAYSLSLGFAPVISFEAYDAKRLDSCSCQQAQKACRPSFVFSIPGQVNFRTALQHLLNCQSRMCSALRKKVQTGMQTKLNWLWQQEALVGCLHIQPFIYGARKVMDVMKKDQFAVVAKHLAKCPQESCARLRRSLLLSIREQVSPAALKNQL